MTKSRDYDDVTCPFYTKPIEGYDGVHYNFRVACFEHRCGIWDKVLNCCSIVSISRDLRMLIKTIKEVFSK